MVGAEGRDYEFENMYENDGARNGMKQLRIERFFFSFLFFLRKWALSIRLDIGTWCRSGAWLRGAFIGMAFFKICWEYQSELLARRLPFYIFFFFYVPSSYLRRQILKALASSNLNLFLLTFATPPPSTPAFPE